MKAATIYIIATILLLALSATATTRRAGQAAQVVIRTQDNGEWQMFVFGPACGDVKNMQVVWPTDPATQPIEIECDNPGKK